MNNNRGNAVIELLLCMLPYMLIMLGAIFFWHLVAGKQEAVKFFTTSSNLSDATIESSSFFGKLKGTAYVDSQMAYTNEEEFNNAVRISDEDEPVLPYDKDGGDLMRAFDLSATQVYFDASASGYKIGRTQAGRRAADLGLMNNLDTSQVYNEGDDITVEITDEADILPQISTVLGEWVEYRSSSANYSYSIPFGRNSLPFESNTASSQQWRSSDGIQVFSQPVSAFAAVIENSSLRSWGGDESTLSSDLADNFKTSDSGAVNPATLKSSKISSTYIDVGIVHSSTIP